MLSVLKWVVVVFVAIVVVVVVVVVVSSLFHLCRMHFLHHYQFDDSISNLSVVVWYFSILYIFF